MGCRLCVTGFGNSGSVQDDAPPSGALALEERREEDAAWRGRAGLPCGTPACCCHALLGPFPKMQQDGF